MRRRPWRNGKRYRTVSLFGVLAVSAALMPWQSVYQAHKTGPVDFKAAAVPTPTHVVVVVEENRSQSNIIGNKSAPYINQLAANGAMMAQSFAEVHPSQPNYYALFAGNTLVNDNNCPVDAGNTPNLGSELLAAGYTFAGYAESLPAVGSTECKAGKYARKHVPWVSFSNIPSSYSLPFSAFPTPANYPSLPTVAFVTPNLDDDMHDGSIAAGDAWLYQNLSQYAAWAKVNNSLLILTWDLPESDSYGDLRGERQTRRLRRDHQPLQRVVHAGADVRAAQARLRDQSARDH
jgi:phosphatidylinositol-3-phosphatase